MKFYMLILIFASIFAGICQSYGRNHVCQSEIKVKSRDNVCEAKSNWTIVANIEECHQFWLCVNGKAEKFTCAANFHFDRIEKRCKMGECPTAESTSKCKSHNVRHIDGNCEAFSLCENEKCVVQNCTKGQYFSKKYSCCQPITINADHKCSCLLPSYAIIGNPDDCESYYMCIDGKAELHRCPHGQYYNKQVSSCLPDLTGVCLGASAMSSNELDLQQKCNQLTNNITTFLPFPSDCNQFFVCLNGRVFARFCPKGSFYDSEMHFCRWNTSEVCTKKKVLNGEQNMNVVTKEIHNRPARKPIISIKREEKQNEVSPNPNAINSSEDINVKKGDFENKVLAPIRRPSVYNKLISKFIQF